jgi:hypothetical protein
MNDFTMAELGVFCGVLGGVLTSLILTIQKSKCETISCCGAQCKRTLAKPKLVPEDSNVSATITDAP